MQVRTCMGRRVHRRGLIWPPMAERCDAIVVGAGPAGASAAITLRRFRPEWRVALLDRSDFPRDKACGDGIAGDAFDELARIGVHGVEGDAPEIWDLHLTGPNGAMVVGRGRKSNRVIRRIVFDARLVDAAIDAGARLHRHHVRQVDVADRMVTVDGAFTAPVLIAADGANSVIRRRLGIAPPADRHRALAVRAYADAADGQDAQYIDMIGEGWPSYAWSFPLEDGKANIGYGRRLTGLDGHARDALLANLQHLAAGPADPNSIAMHPLPLSTGRPRPDHGRVLLTGDAAGLINPLTGEGIFYAIASGRMAAIAALRSSEPGRMYRSMMRRRFSRHFATTSVLARLLDHPAMFSLGIDAVCDPRAFADLADIGLGEGVMTPHLLGSLLRAGRSHLKPRSGAIPVDIREAYV